MSGRRSVLLSIVSMLAALLVANALGDSLRLLGSGDLRSLALVVVVIGMLAAAYGAAYGRLLDASPGASAAIATLTATLVGFVLARFPSPWSDLGPFGAGPLTAIAVVLLPIAQLAAIFAVRRWAPEAAKRRGPRPAR